MTQTEITFKYYLPDNEHEVYCHMNSKTAYSLLWKLDQFCRTVLKHGIDHIKDENDLAQKIRDMIHEKIDMDRLP